VNDTSLASLTSPEIVIPANADFTRATFDHWVATEPGWDGGNLKVSVNGGAWQLIPPGSYAFNGHNVLLFSAGQGNTNPLAGQPSWSGNNNGTVNGGSWGRTLVNLGGFAKAGDKVRLRWDFGTDICSGRTGWYLDNVNVFSCQANVPKMTIADARIRESASGSALTFDVSLDAATLRNVTVTYTIVEGTARHGVDFTTKPLTGVVTIPAGSRTRSVTVIVNDDPQVEEPETVFVKLSGVVNAELADGEATGIIEDNDAPTTTTTPPDND